MGGRVVRGLHWQALRLGRLAAQLMRQRRFRPDAPDAAASGEAERLLGLILPELDLELKATPFACGQRPTLADIAIFTSVDYLRLAGFDDGCFTDLGRWFDACAGRPTWAASAHPLGSA